MLFSEFGLDKRLLAMLKHTGFIEATGIQERAIPIAIAGRDLVACSQTGSGKTLAFLLPAVHRTLTKKSFHRNDPRVLILLPTRELAQQVYVQLRQLLPNGASQVVSLLGGENFNDQIKKLQKYPKYIVGTPGRVDDHLKQRNFFLDGLEVLILDEADRMLDLGFKEQLVNINEQAKHNHRQTLLFSATLDQSHAVHDFAKDLVKYPEIIIVNPIQSEHQDIVQSLYLADNLTHKEALLLKLLTKEQTILFTATRLDSERLATFLSSKGFISLSLHGLLKQDNRTKIISEFRHARAQILVTTDVASRGLDIPDVAYVINFDLPKNSEEYIHRIGRTGRAGSKGNAISLVGPNDWENFKKIEGLLQKTFSFATIEGFEANFKGFKIKPKEVKQKTAIKTKKSVHIKRKREAPDLANAIDVGDEPFRLKLKPTVR